MPYIILFYTKMKQKLSVSIEENLLTLLDGMLDDGRFRNKSHVMEFALNKLIKEIKNE